MNENEDHIRRRAYEIWEQEGRPQGEDLNHWVKALQEIAAKPAPAKKAKSTKKAADKSAAASPAAAAAAAPAKTRAKATTSATRH